MQTNPFRKFEFLSNILKICYIQGTSYGLINSAKLKQYKTIVILGCTNDSLPYKDSKVLPGKGH